MPRDVLTGGVERSRDRARRFGREHTKTQKPGEVTLTLTPAMGSETTVHPSAHPIKVVAVFEVEPGVLGKPVPVTELAPGVGAALRLGAKGWAVDRLLDVRKAPETPS